jgi:hypothetical protein
MDIHPGAVEAHPGVIEANPVVRVFTLELRILTPDPLKFPIQPRRFILELYRLTLKPWILQPGTLEVTSVYHSTKRRKYGIPYMEFRGIPRNFGRYSSLGIPRNSAKFNTNSD